MTSTPGEEPAASVPDLGSIMSQVLQAQAAVHSAQQAAAAQVVEGRSGGGAVRVRATGGLSFESVTIDPSVIDPAEPEILGDLVLAAVRDALDQVRALSTEALGALDLGALQGLLGGA